MIFEILIAAGGILGSMVVAGACSSAGPTYDDPQFPTKPTPVLSDTVLLIKELFETDSGWSKVSDNSHLYRYYTNYKHTSGVRVIKSWYPSSDTHSINVYIMGEDKIYGNFNLSSAESTAISGFIDAYEDRAKDREQNALQRALAKRLLSGETVSGLLGDGRVSSSSDDSKSDSLGKSDSDSTGLLVYDDKSGKVVLVGKSSVGVKLDEKLKSRYGLAKNVKSDTTYYRDVHGNEYEIF